MQAVTVGSGWTYRVSFDILNGNDAGIFALKQEQSSGTSPGDWRTLNVSLPSAALGDHQDNAAANESETA